MYRWMTTVLVVLVITLSACGRDNHDHSDTLSGKALFELHCASCHGPTGTGSVMLGVPANNDGHLLNVEIRNKIQHGSVKDDDMPIFHDMSDEEANKIITYINKLARH